MNATVVHVKGGVWKRDDPNCVYIGRPSKWGNKFIVGLHGTREECIDKYREWIKRQPLLLADLKELDGKLLGCYCSPKKCHGDVLVKLLKKIK